MNVVISKCDFCTYSTPDKKCNAPTMSSRVDHCLTAIQKMTTVMSSEKGKHEA